MINQKKNYDVNKEIRIKTSVLNDVKIDNAEDLDVVMPMYSLLESSENYILRKQRW